MSTKNIRQRLIILLFLFVVMAILSACAGGAAPEEPAAPAEEPAEEPAAEEPAVPEEPIEPSDQYPVQYGQDSRTELFQHSDAKLREMAGSVAVLVHTQQVNISENTVTLDGHTLNEMSEMGWLVSGISAPMCSNELFTAQPAPGFCTGFLVDEDILVTAGHCLQKTPCSETDIVFGFQMASNDSLATLNNESVFKCAEVLAQEVPSQNNSYLDYAIIKLDRPTGRPGLEFESNEPLGIQNNVAVLGHPSGLPMKIASDAFVISNNPSDPFFITNLDTFGSNSGSPVINTETYKVEGILVSGEIDYVLSEDGSCIQVNRCPESGGTNCSGENVTKMVMLAEGIQDSRTKNPGGLNCIPNLMLVIVGTILMWLRRN